ncbi:MAG: ABC transporter ATP-binding protein [Bacteroidia bacterium]|nr:ABC transporter ATP-binding protein [Bacteroidia bacterium]
MIEAKDIYKSYDTVEVLKGISLKIEAGEVVSITGDSGAGKSTLLHALSSLDQPNSGEIIFEGKSLSDLSKNQLAKFRNEEVGFVFQNHQLLSELTAIENVCLPAWIGKTSKTDAKKKGVELLKYLGLDRRVDHKPSQMSGGEQQRVAVARALINAPKVVFADEPMGNLDSKNADLLFDYFLQLRAEFNTSFVIVTHNRMLATKTDRNIALKDGKIA